MTGLPGLFSGLQKKQPAIEHNQNGTVYGVQWRCA